MNNFNILLKIRNPKKQALGTKLETMACYLTNRRIDEKRNESRNHWIGNLTSRVRVAAMRRGSAAEKMQGMEVGDVGMVAGSKV